MTTKEKALAILRFKLAESMPVVPFGFWLEAAMHEAGKAGSGPALGGSIPCPDYRRTPDADRDSVACAWECGCDCAWDRSRNTFCGEAP